MRRERRKNRFLRRIVLGLAVAALVAPAAQARLDSGTAAQGNAAEQTAVIHGENKGEYPPLGDSAVVIHGENKGEYPPLGDSAVVIHGENKGEYPAPGDSTAPVFVQKPVQYTVAGLPLGLQDDGNRVDTPVEAVRSPGSFDWGDALVGAGVAFGLMLLLGGATLATRHVRPAAA